MTVPSPAGDPVDSFDRTSTGLGPGWRQLETAGWVQPDDVEPEDVRAQMICGGCRDHMGVYVSPVNAPHALVVTCTCGYVNRWEPVPRGPGFGVRAGWSSHG